MTKKLQRTSRRFLLLITAVLSLGPARSPAALLEVEQTIWGMDCAPCAYGMQRGLEKLPGVGKVTVSLNRGHATLMMHRNNRLSLAAIQQVVRDGGFTPKEALLRLEGTIQLDADQPHLHTEGATYALRAPADGGAAWSRLRQTENGARVIVRGTAPADKTDEVTVHAVEF